MYIFFAVFGLLTVLPVHMCEADSNTLTSNCVSNYVEFEKATFGNNTHNRDRLYQALYPPYGHVPYSLLVTYKAVLPNGSETTCLRSPDTATCDDVQWVWLSSTAFLYSRPDILNRLSLYTLNFFEEWEPETVNITVPCICNEQDINKILVRVTTSVSPCASREIILYSRIYQF